MRVFYKSLKTLIHRFESGCRLLKSPILRAFFYVKYIKMGETVSYNRYIQIGNSILYQ